MLKTTLRDFSLSPDIEERPISIVLPDSFSSGAKKVMVEIAKAISSTGLVVDLVVATKKCEIKPTGKLRVLSLGVCENTCRWLYKLKCFLPLVRYFQKRKPLAVIPVFDFLNPL